LLSFFFVIAKIANFVLLTYLKISQIATIRILCQLKFALFHL